MPNAMRLLTKNLISVSNFLNNLLHVDSGYRSTFDIILWWEFRRLVYNIIVLVCGVSSIIIMTTVASCCVKLEPGEDFYEPIVVL